MFVLRALILHFLVLYRALRRNPKTISVKFKFLKLSSIARYLDDLFFH